MGHNKRRQTANRRLAELVHGGDLGDLQYIETHISVPVAFKPSVPEWRQQPEQLPAGGMTPLGVHMVDAIGYLGGAVTEVFTMSRRVFGRYEVEDVTSVVLGLEVGTAGIVDHSDGGWPGDHDRRIRDRSLRLVGG